MSISSFTLLINFIINVYFCLQYSLFVCIDLLLYSLLIISAIVDVVPNTRRRPSSTVEP